MGTVQNRGSSTHTFPGFGGWVSSHPWYWRFLPMAPDPRFNMSITSPFYIHLIFYSLFHCRLFPSKLGSGHWLDICVLFWNFIDRKCSGSRSKKYMGSLRSYLSEKLKSLSGVDNIYSISLVLFQSFSLNPYFYIKLLFTFVYGDLVSCYLLYILCIIIFQLQIITGRCDYFLAPLFITLCTQQFIFPDQVSVSDVQVSWFITVLLYFLSWVSSCSPAVIWTCILLLEGFNWTVKALMEFISIIQCDYVL